MLWASFCFGLLHRCINNKITSIAWRNAAPLTHSLSFWTLSHIIHLASVNINTLKKLSQFPQNCSEHTHLSPPPLPPPPPPPHHHQPAKKSCSHSYMSTTFTTTTTTITTTTNNNMDTLNNKNNSRSGHCPCSNVPSISSLPLFRLVQHQLLSLLLGKTLQNGLPLALPHQLLLLLEQEVGSSPPLRKLLIGHVILAKDLGVRLTGWDGHWLEPQLWERSKDQTVVITNCERTKLLLLLQTMKEPNCFTNMHRAMQNGEKRKHWFSLLPMEGGGGGKGGGRGCHRCTERHIHLQPQRYLKGWTILISIHVSSNRPSQQSVTSSNLYWTKFAHQRIKHNGNTILHL